MQRTLEIGETTAVHQLVLVFIHGFLGSEESFGKFPRELRKTLKTQGIIPANVSVLCWTYCYKTQGKFEDSVTAFTEWLMQLSDIVEGGSERKGATKFVLCGHSMGGLVMADAVKHLRSFQRPDVIACIAYDTPYLGLKALDFRMRKFVQRLLTLGNVSLIATLSLLAYIFAPHSLKLHAYQGILDGTQVILCIAGIVTTYFLLLRNHNPAEMLKILFESLEFLRALDRPKVEKRLKRLIRLDQKGEVAFTAFYVECPQAGNKRFIHLPSRKHAASKYFVCAQNMKQGSEIMGHMSMFDESLNYEYRWLLDCTARTIEDALHPYI